MKKCCATCISSIPNAANPEKQVLCLFNPPTPILTQIHRSPEGLFMGSEQVSVFPIMQNDSACRKWEPKEDAPIDIGEAKGSA